MLEVIDDCQRLEAIGPAWTALAANSPSPLLGHDWMAASAATFSTIGKPAVFVLWQGERIRAAAPLGLFRQGLTQRLHLIGYLLREPNALLFEDEAALEELLAAIIRHGVPFSLARLGAGGPEERVLQQVRRGGVPLVRARTGATHAAILPDTVAALEAAMSASVRSSMRRKLKRAARFGTVSFTVERSDVAGVGASIDELIRIEGSGWKGREGTAIAASTTLRQFFHDFAARAAAAGTLRVYRMTIDGKTVAIRLAAVAAGTCYELKIAFDERFGEVSPGLLLTHETLKMAIGEGLSRHEFLGMAEDWQKHWLLERKEQVSYRSYPLRPAGALAIGQDVYGKLRDRLIRAAGRVPSPELPP